jgi:hypothetical protein
MKLLAGLAAVVVAAGVLLWAAALLTRAVELIP